MEAAATTPSAITSLDDTTQEYVQEEPLDDWTPPVDETLAAVITLNEDDEAAATRTTITSVKDDDTIQDYVQEVPLEIRNPPVDGGQVGVAVTLNENEEDLHATMAKKLPKIVIIQSNEINTYLHLWKENPVVPNSLRYSGYSFGLETRFELVPATVDGLVHIRSLLNNKYWANFGTGTNWVSAMAIKPEENQANRLCTLFRPERIQANSDSIVRLRHINTGHYVSFFRVSGLYYGALMLMPDPRPSDNDFVCTFIDWETVVVFPDRIRIKNISNGNHLLARDDEYIDMRNQADNSSRFDYEVIPSRNGGIRLKSVTRNTYWSEESNTYILLKPGTAHNTNTVFIPTVIPGQGVLFRSMRSGRYCKRYSVANRPAWRDLLAARINYPDEWSYMEIEEPVLSRRITDVTYRFDDALIYNQDDSALITDRTDNRTTQTIEGEFNLKRTVTNTASWSNSVTWKVGVTMSLNVGIPKIGSAGFEVSTEFSEERSWGETKTESVEVGNVRTFPVPPMRRVEGRLLATRASYDIPFSYTQRDILSNGHHQNTRKHDGIFTGRDGYGYDYEFVELPLP